MLIEFEIVVFKFIKKFKLKSIIFYNIFIYYQSNFIFILKEYVI